MTRALLAIFLLALLPAVACAAVGPDLYDRVGSLPLQGVRAFDTDGRNIYLLFDNAIALVDASQLGVRLSVAALAQLQQQYDQLYRNGDWLYLSSSEGKLSVMRTFSDTLAVLSEIAMDDSVLSVAAKGRYLYLAEGFSGIRILDAGCRASPRSVGRAAFGAYYSLLTVKDTLLFAVDRLNGIDIYLIRDSSLLYRSTIPTELPVLDLLPLGRSLFACDGSQIVRVWNLDDPEHPLQTHELAFADRAILLAGLEGNALIGFEQGRILTYDLDADATEGRYELGYPLEDLGVAKLNEEITYFTLDQSGRVVLLSSDATDLVVVKEYIPEDLPSAMAAWTDGVVVAKSGRGLFYLTFDSGGVKEKLLYESGLGFSSLVVRNSYLFAAVADSQVVMIFELTNNEAIPSMSLATHQVTRQLFVQAAEFGAYHVIAIGSSGAEAVTALPAEGRTTPRWKTQSRLTVTCGFCDDRSLLLASEEGDVDYYCLDCNWPKPFLRGRLQAAPSPRSVLMIGGRYLVTAGKSGVSVDEFIFFTERFEHVAGLAAVSSATALAYDDRQGLLVVACSDEELKYTDFSQPDSLGAVYSIRGSHGATMIAVGDGEIYSLESGALAAYRSRQAGRAAHVMPGRLRVSECFPNPFNGVTAIEVAAAEGDIDDGEIEYQILNILGQVIEQARIDGARRYLRIIWDGASNDAEPVGSGVYFFRLQTQRGCYVRKMLLVK